MKIDLALLRLCWHCLKYLQQHLRRRASCVEETHISQNESPQVPGLPSAQTSLLCFYTCLLFLVSSLPWERKLFLQPAVYETFSRRSFRAACQCSFFTCQLPQKAKATPWMLRLLDDSLNESCPQIGHLCHCLSVGDNKLNSARFLC